MKPFVLEWQLLQNQYDAYEKWSLVIKLAAVLVCVFALDARFDTLLLVLLLATLWGLDAIWKTFQARIENRLILVEAQIEKHKLDDEIEEVAMQFNRQFQLQRPGLAGLLSEYAKSALRPTIAFPHVVLVLLSLLAPLF